MKKDIIAHMREKAGMTADQANAALDAVTAAISSVATVSEKAHIPGFGTFRVKQRAERMGRNPATGETIRIAATKALTFKEVKRG